MSKDIEVVQLLSMSKIVACYVLITMSISSSATTWLSLETAAQATSVSIETLQACLDTAAPEKCFQSHGLLFDRERWQAGEAEFLQLLEQSTSPAKRSAERSPNSADRSYQWDTALIRVEICWQPLALDSDERQVLITATSYDDFPVCELIGESELGDLPPVLSKLLDELRLELSVRQICYQKQSAKGKGKVNANSSAASRSSTPLTTASSPANQPAQPIQTSLL